MKAQIQSYTYNNCSVSVVYLAISIRGDRRRAGSAASRDHTTKIGISFGTVFDPYNLP